MKKNSKIILLTDFSEISGHATEFALKIGSNLKSKIQLLHILNTPVDWVKIPKEKEDLYPETKKAIAIARSRLADLSAQFEKAGLETSSNIGFNFGPENIASHLDKIQAEMVIMGSHGNSGFKNFAIGSNAQKVLRNVKTPTLIIKKSQGSAPVKKIAFATTFEKGQLEPFERLKTFALAVGAQLDLVYVNTPYEFKESEELERQFSAFGEPSTTIQVINALNEERGLVFYTEKNQPDLLAIASSGKSGFAQFFAPSLTENLVNQFDIPILAIH